MFKSFVLLILIAVVIGGGHMATAQGQTAAAKVFNEWLPAFNSGDSGKLLAFWQKYGSGAADAQVSRDEHLRQMTGGFTLLKVTQDSESHVVVSLKDERGGYAEITLDLASTEPPVVKNMVGHPVPPPASERSPLSNDQELVAEVNKHVADLLSQGRFSGAVLIAHRGKPVLDQAWGLADREKNIKNTTETQFCIGSMNKMFTAVAVLQLVQQGKLSLDATLSHYWPNYPNHDLASKVTIRQLLTHTGGTGDIFTPEYEAHRSEIRTLDDYIKLFGQRDVRFQPGSKFEYSNYGFILLGRLIEIVTGKHYDSYLQKQIYGPAGMMHTSSRPQTDQAPARAIGYMQTPGGVQPNTGTLPWSGTSAGGGYSTTGDLLRFATALQSGKLLDPELLKEATSDQSHANYGFGFSAHKDRSYGHGGGAPGVNGELRIFPTGYVVVVLENLDPPSATLMENYIEARLPIQ